MRQPEATGKTSACMYPYVEQLLRWRAKDADRKIGGLVLEVKGDFCRQVRSILTRAERQDDYVEIGLDSGVCYNPLHNDMDPYELDPVPTKYSILRRPGLPTASVGRCGAGLTEPPR